MHTAQFNILLIDYNILNHINKISDFSNFDIGIKECHHTKQAQ